MPGGKGGQAQIVGYRYTMGLHQGLCRGPVDSLKEIRVGDLVVMSGGVTFSSFIDINQPTLFGGDEKEGGIQGSLKVFMGEPTQTVDSIIIEGMQVGSPVPAWRGVLTAFYYGLIASNNPYPKPWKFKVNRILKGWENDDPWNPADAKITLSSNPITLIGFINNPADGDQLDIDGTLIFFVTAGADANEVVIGSDVSETVTNLVAYLNFHSASFNNAVASGSATQVQVIFSVPTAVTEWQGDFCTIAQQGGTVEAMNGAHIIYQCATDTTWGRGLPASMIDAVAFAEAAETLANEKLGLCIRWNREEDIDKFVQTVVNHIGAAVYIDRQTGLLTLKLLRADYDPASLTTYTFDDGLLDIEEDGSSSSDQLYNEIIVQYLDPITGRKGQVRAQNLASIQALGTVISTTVEYLGCPTAELAGRLAMRDLRINSGDLRRMKIKMNRMGLTVAPGSVFKISVPSRGIADLVLRAGDIDDPVLTDGTITITAIQDVFSLPSTTYIAEQPSFWAPIDRAPRAIFARSIGELTYFDTSSMLPAAELGSVQEDTGFIKIFAGPPNAATFEYLVTTKASGEADFANHGIAGYDEVAALSILIGPYDTDLSFTTSSTLDAVLVGQPVLINDEYCKIVAIDALAGTMTIDRGCIDTIPQRHGFGSRIWFQTNAPTTDARDYATGEDVDVRLLSRTALETLDPAFAATDVVTIGGRQGRPYPPGDFKINGVPGLGGALAAGDVVFTWAHRDRIIQGNFLLEHSAASTGPEVGVTYTIRVYIGTDPVPTILLRTEAGISAATWTYTGAMATADGSYDSLWFELESVRAGLVSWQKYQVKVVRSSGFDDDFDENFDGGP